MVYKDLERRKEYLKEYKARLGGLLKAKARAYYQENREKILKKQKEYCEKNTGKRVKTRKKSYHKNKKKYKERIKEYEKEYNKRPEVRVRRKVYGKEWREKNLEYVKEHMKEYYQRSEVKAKRREYQKFRRKNDKEWIIRARLRGSLRKALNIYSTTGKIMSSKKYGMDIKAIIEHLKPFPKDIENYHIDHIVPLSWFDFNNPKEIKWAIEPTNHQWLTKEENISKGNRFISVC